jgi:hypothetical protein
MPLPIKIDLDGLGELMTGAGAAAKDFRAALTGKAILDPDKAAEIEMKANELENALLLAQAKINEAEAAKGGFAGSWRPFIGWVCGVSLAYQYLLAPVGTWALRLAGITVEAPMLDMATLMPLTLGMLGLVAARSYDKGKGTA